MNILYLFSISIIISGSLYPVFALDISQTCNTSNLPPRWPSSHIYITDTSGSVPYIPLTHHTTIFHDDDVWNISTQPRTVQVTLKIQDQVTGQQVFNQTQSLQMQACSGPESIKWRFVPIRDDNYYATVSDNRGNVNMIFYSISSPLEQLRFGVDSHNVICEQDLQLVIKSKDGSPACVKPDTVKKLIERGWAKEIVSTNHPRETQMELRAYGFVCCGLDGDLLKGYLSTSNSFVSNATVQISTNGIVMGYAKTFSDGCFQFNQWNESKLSEQTDAFLENEKKWGVYKPFNLTFTAHFAGDKNYGPSTMQTASTMSLTAVPMAPPQLETTLTPTQVNLTQGSSTNFQISIRPMVEQWNVPHLNLYLEGYPCETDFRLSQSSGNTTASTTHPALFDGTMSASTDSPEGKYFVHMMQNGTNHFVANDIGTFPLNIMKMK